MNIYDLEKQATAAPWFGRYSTVLGRTAPESPREQHICSTDENWLPCEEKIANGALIRHCRNHYMGALAALKNVEHKMEHDSTCNVRYHDTAECDCGKSELQHLIAELEEVKT